MDGIHMFTVKDRPLIIALDFDGVIVENGAFPEDNFVLRDLIINKTLQLKKELGNMVGFILYTCREWEYLQNAMECCDKLGLPIDCANSDHVAFHGYKMFFPEYKRHWWTPSRKPNADIYVDDKAFGSVEFYLSMQPVDLGVCEHCFEHMGIVVFLHKPTMRGVIVCPHCQYKHK